MYLPRHFHQDDARRIAALLAAADFATLAAVIDGRLEASPLPFLHDPGPDGAPGLIRGHVARGNPIARAFDGATELTLLIAGPDAYISPDWYATPGMVPTWNYVALHLAGRARVLADGELQGLLDDLSARHEARLLPKPPWTSAKLTAQALAALRQAITGFALTVERVEPKWKLGQNRKPADREGAIAGLRGRGDPASLAVAALMEENR